MLRRNLLIILLAGAAVVIVASLGCDDLVTQTIKTTIAGQPTAEFLIRPDSGCAPLFVTFEDASSGPVRTWIWNFGDSAFDTILYTDTDSGIGDVSHTYAASGSYTVTLSVFDSLDGSDAETKKRAVIVGHNVDSVTLSDVLVCPGEDITFHAYNPYGVSTWRWDFGDGTAASTDDSVIQTHSYDEAGLYQFKLTVTGECGTRILVDTVQVLNCARPYFAAEPDTGCVSLTVTFTDSSGPAIDSSGTNYDTVGAIIEWHWNFGNGTTQTFTSLPGPININYTAAGKYPVTLTVTTETGGTTSYTDTIVAYPNAAATFTAQPVAACQTPGRQFLVAFSRAATGDTAWIWDFGDGDSAFVQNPYHAYTEPGYYTVSLAVLGACGVDTTTIERDSLVVVSDPLSLIDLQLSGTEVDTLTEVIATDASPAAAVVHRIFTFGSDSPVSTNNVVWPHRFGDTGTYWVKLTRYNTCDTLRDSVSVHVSLPPAP